VQNPVKTIRNSSFTALFIITVLYELANVAYFAAGKYYIPEETVQLNANFNEIVSRADLKASTQIAASLFFQNVFGSGNAVRGLNFLIALSAFGNLLAVLIGQSRLIRECGR
jgi:amino acid transporter